MQINDKKIIDNISDIFGKNKLELVRVLTDNFSMIYEPIEKDEKAFNVLTEFTALEKPKGLNEFIIRIVTVVTSIMG